MLSECGGILDEFLELNLDEIGVRNLFTVAHVHL